MRRAGRRARPPRPRPRRPGRFEESLPLQYGEAHGTLNNRVAAVRPPACGPRRTGGPRIRIRTVGGARPGPVRRDRPLGPQDRTSGRSPGPPRPATAAAGTGSPPPGAGARHG